jgi:lysozyme
MSRVRVAVLLATAIAIPAEGLRQYAYYDPPGILTVCYGTTGADVKAGKKYSLSECKAFLDRDMLNAINTVERCAPRLPSNVLAAFGDAVYNLGPAIVCNPEKSTAARHLKAGRLIDACNQLPRWSRASVGGVYVELPGLVKRRNAEKELCLQGLT